MTFQNFPSLLGRRDFVKTAGLLAAGSALATRASAAQSDVHGRPLEQTSLLEPLSAPDGSAALTGPLAPPDKQPPKLKVPEENHKVGWAVVGLGQLALEESLPAFRECEWSKITALVSGHADKARKIAAVYGVEPTALYDYSSFERMADNPAIEAVYIVLPNSMHAEFTIKALRAGKHVLCEKPMAASLKEANDMIAAAKQADRLLGIAYRLHHEPHTQMAMELCRSKAFGELKQFSSANCQTVRAPNIRLSASTGGGPVSDVGVYSINAVRSCTGEEPSEVFATASWGRADPRFREVPESVAYTLRFPSGLLASCECSFGTARSSRFRVLGTRGFVEMDPAFPYQGQTLKLSQQPTDDGDPQVVQYQLKAVNQFTKEFDSFSKCIRKNLQPKTPGAMGLADLRVVLAIQESIRTGQTVKLS